MTTTASPCPARGCTRTQPAGVTLCRPCWYALPKSLRNKLWRAVGTPDLLSVQGECVERAEQNIHGKATQERIA